MKKSVQILFHLLFWIFTSLLVILVYTITQIPNNLFGGGPSAKEILSILFFTLIFGAIIFYSSYFLLNYFAKNALRFLFNGICYFVLIPVSIQVSKWLFGFNDGLLIFMIFFLALYFNILGFLFRTFIEWFKDRKIKAELEKDKVKKSIRTS